MGLLSGLGRFGLDNLENVNVYEEAKPLKKVEVVKPVPKAVQEQDFLFDRTYSCPVCGREFKNRMVRTGKAKLIGSDIDLRPRYEQLDILKYDVVLCPICGYTALGRFFEAVTPLQAKNIINAISVRFTSPVETKEIYTYDDALERYQMALANAVVKKAKASEKAYICLKTAWILRGRGENLDQSLPDYKMQKEQCGEKETEFLRHALDGFLEARRSETFPVCGIDQYTADYLIAAIAARFEKYDLSGRLVTEILLSKSAGVRVKNRARDLKEILVQKLKEKKDSSE